MECRRCQGNGHVFGMNWAPDPESGHRRGEPGKIQCTLCEGIGRVKVRCDCCRTLSDIVADWAIGFGELRKFLGRFCWPCMNINIEARLSRAAVAV